MTFVANPAIGSFIGVMLYWLIGQAILVVAQAISSPEMRKEMNPVVGVMFILLWPIVAITMVMAGLCNISIDLGNRLGDFLDKE